MPPIENGGQQRPASRRRFRVPLAEFSSLNPGAALQQYTTTPWSSVTFGWSPVLAEVLPTCQPEYDVISAGMRAAIVLA